MKNPYLGLFISVISVSFAAIFIVTALSPPLTIAFNRLLFTVFFMAVFVLINKNYRQELRQLSLYQALSLIAIGAILSAHFSLWITSLTQTSIASSVILVSVHPLLVIPLSYHLYHEKLRCLNILGVMISLFGIIILVLGNYSLSSMTFKGNLLALLGGMATGGYILGGRKMRKDLSTPCYALVVYGVACFILFLLCLLAQSPLTATTNQDYQIFFLMALIPGLFGHTLYNWSLKYIPASIASVALLGEPLGSSVLAMIVPWINQIPTLYTPVGGLFIFLGIYLASHRKVKTGKGGF